MAYSGLISIRLCQLTDTVRYNFFLYCIVLLICYYIFRTYVFASLTIARHATPRNATRSCKSLSTLATATVAENGDCRRIRRQSPFSVTVWTGLNGNKPSGKILFCYSMGIGLGLING